MPVHMVHFITSHPSPGLSPSPHVIPQLSQASTGDDPGDFHHRTGVEGPSTGSIMHSATVVQRTVAPLREPVTSSPRSPKMPGAVLVLIGQ